MSEIYTKERLAELQAMSLDEKIEVTQDRIEDWYMQFSGNVYVSFSGGKDSTVLLHLVREMFLIDRNLAGSSEGSSGRNDQE